MVVPSKTMILDQNGQSLNPSSDQNGAKTLPFWGRTYLHRLYKGVSTLPPPPPPTPGVSMTIAAG